MNTINSGHLLFENTLCNLGVVILIAVCSILLILDLPFKSNLATISIFWKPSSQGKCRMLLREWREKTKVSEAEERERNFKPNPDVYGNTGSMRHRHHSGVENTQRKMVSPRFCCGAHRYTSFKENSYKCSLLTLTILGHCISCSPNSGMCLTLCFEVRNKLAM